MLEFSSLSLLTEIRHPQYTWTSPEWAKWRLTMAGGRAFVNAYLQKFSTREDDDDFTTRANLTYCAGYAKSSIKEIINAVFQRMRDITRVGGPENYVNAVAGREGGVNREGMSMNMFMGKKVLPELLSMGQVGIYIDMPANVEGATLADTYNLRPYLYHYPVEDILCWNYTNQELQSVVLRDCVYTYDVATGMPNGTDIRFRYIWKDEHGDVYVNSFTGTSPDSPKKKFEIKDVQEYKLGLKQIPFILVDIGESLLTDIADYQIVLTNIESSDIAYILQANFPFYTEQKNSHIAPTHTKKPGEAPDEVQTGPLIGRSYPIGADRPDFIHPSPEPLLASMKKQEEIRQAIRHLVHLAVSKLSPQRESADSKALDNEGLEAGLAFIGLTLEHAENYIGERWSEYTNGIIPTVKYPSQYSLKSDSERRADAKSIFDMRDDLPTTLGRKELVKLAVRTLFDGRVAPNVMDDILDEISASPYVSGRTEDVERDVEQGLVTKATASQARGYAPEEANKANTEFMDRLKFINDTQTSGEGGRSLPENKDKSGLKNPAARGVRDLSPAPDKDAAAEKGAS